MDEGKNESGTVFDQFLDAACIEFNKRRVMNPPLEFEGVFVCSGDKDWLKMSVKIDGIRASGFGYVHGDLTGEDLYKAYDELCEQIEGIKSHNKRVARLTALYSSAQQSMNRGGLGLQGLDYVDTLFIRELIEKQERRPFITGNVLQFGDEPERWKPPKAERPEQLMPSVQWSPQRQSLPSQ